MGYKKRGYQRDVPAELVRDYKLFAIVCEGSKREPQYFNVFQYLSTKIKVDIIEQHVTDNELFSIHESKSSPKWVLDRAISYISKNDLKDEDELWFVIDVDRWSHEQIRALYYYCEQYKNWNLVISNPCFEVWLYFHKKETIENPELLTCKDFKTAISLLDKGGYYYLNFILDIKQAIHNSKKADSDSKHFFPNANETKVYLLGEALIAAVSTNDFDKFLSEKIPELIERNKKNNK